MPQTIFTNISSITPKLCKQWPVLLLCLSLIFIAAGKPYKRELHFGP